LILPLRYLCCLLCETLFRRQFGPGPRVGMGRGTPGRDTRESKAALTPPSSIRSGRARGKDRDGTVCWWGSDPRRGRKMDLLVVRILFSIGSKDPHQQTVDRFWTNQDRDMGRDTGHARIKSGPHLTRLSSTLRLDSTELATRLSSPKSEVRPEGSSSQAGPLPSEADGRG
jgi:hypothetical protein